MGKFTGLAKEQSRALGRLKIIPGIERFYLAGGTAVAVHLRHRRSLDLDLFSISADVDLTMLAQAVRVVVPDLQVISMTDAALRVMVGGIPVDIVRYPYGLLDAPKPGPEAFPMAGVRDLAAMKLAAIARRGLRRDFWDLCALAEGGLPLRDAAAAYVAKFGVSEADLYHVLRSLTYFEDAEKDPVYPRGLTATSWERMKRFFLTEVPKLLIDEKE
ncbi:nucleotidyl transferase AbiEii/AbiGii toxin family protein [Sorangium sp. So ce302]|uniref:nucleotidyl transferase AbiEii/AbiGii toxin family protein n=1 Tax=Sorangium sp. So ce302 TaxID=3133297 RepID=UPI003F6142F1